MSGVVFIDSRVSDPGQLLAGLADDVRVVYLDSALDGIAQIAAALAGDTELDSIQIVSHGSSGTLHLGSTVLTEENLDQYQTPLAQIGASLSDAGDLLLYGCDIGAGASGQRFVESLAARTGADVAASTDTTGSPLLGANWLLEATTGAIEAPASFNTQAQNAYTHTLGAPYLTPAGTLDTTFGGGDGILTTSVRDLPEFGFGPNRLDDLAVQPDGKILATGLANSRTASNLYIVRYNSDGSLDTAFGGGDGLSMTEVQGIGGEILAVLPDGKILVATAMSAVTLLRFNADGTLDVTFDGDGKLAMPSLGGNERYSYALQADGKLLFGSTAGVVRYNSDGGIDTSFGNGGRAAIGASSGIAVQPDGKIVLSRFSDVIRLNSNGTLDNTFHIDGISYRGFSPYGPPVLQPDGMIAIGGGQQGYSVARYSSDGTLDSGFDGDGIATIRFTITNTASWMDLGRALALQADGKLLLAGLSGPTSADDEIVNTYVGLVRFNSDGTVDSTFDGDGRTLIDFPGIIFHNGINIEVQTDGSAIVGSYADGAISLARVMSGGIADQKAEENAPFTLTVPANLFVDPDGGTISYTASLSNGEELPGWLNFDPATRILSGTPSEQELGNLQIVVNGTDSEGLTASDTFVLTVVADEILGTPGDDVLLGTTETDTVLGFAGNDTVYGYLGNDSVFGAEGNDWMHGGQGLDTLRGGFGDDESYGGVGDDYLYGGAGRDAEYGNQGNDEIRGGLDNDTLFGGQGNDTLFGGQNDDLLQGLAHNDVLQGLAGNDVLTGGAGLDQFWFNSAGAANADTITDFDVGGEADTIVLQQLLVTGLSPGALAVGNFVSGAGAAAADGDDYILYDTATGNLSYDADGNGDGASLLIATLTGAPALTADDFLIVA